MAGAAELFLSSINGGGGDFDIGGGDDDDYYAQGTLDGPSDGWSPAFHRDDDRHSTYGTCDPFFFSDSDSETDYHEEEVCLSLGLFDRRSGNLDLEAFGVTEVEEDEVGIDNGLGLELGFGAIDDDDEDDSGTDDIDEGANWCDDRFYVSRRSDSIRPGDTGFARDEEDTRIVMLESESEDELAIGLGRDPIGTVSTPIGEDLGLLRQWRIEVDPVLGFESESEADEREIDLNSYPVDIFGVREQIREDLGPSHFWPIDEDPIEDLEWEEVRDMTEEREEATGMAIDSQEGSPHLDILSEFMVAEQEVGEVATTGYATWDVLMGMNDLHLSSDAENWDNESFTGPDIYDVPEFEVFLGQFINNDSPIGGSPPAAKSVVKNLPSIVMTEEDKGKNNNVCAVCKDDIAIGVAAKQLPCLHHYHEDCILPWLKIRNTCPVCRHELPTEDPQHENGVDRMTRAVGRIADESQPFGMLF